MQENVDDLHKSNLGELPEDTGKKPRVYGPAVASLILSLLGLGTFGILGVPGFVLGLIADNRIYKSEGKLAGRIYSLLAIIIGFFGLLFLVIQPPTPRAEIAYRMFCGTHLAGLGRCFAVYAGENNGEYPPFENWCDCLIRDANATENLFVCNGARRAGSEARCHYAMNPNARPDSAGDVVLLFETKGGWNLYGGRELLSFENHEGQGCNILFVDGHVDFCTARLDPNELNWGEADL